MSQTDKPSLADIARKNNSARTSKFASSMVPAAPQITPPVEPAAESVPEAEPDQSLVDVIAQGETDFAQGRGTTLTVDELKAIVPPASVPGDTPKPAPQTTDVATSVRPGRKRSAAMNLADDILTPKAPEEEVYGKMTRIAEKHHELLRRIAFEHRKPMNTILYNLLEVLDQTYQRDQQKDV